jgi:hypothetical protein
MDQLTPYWDAANSRFLGPGMTVQSVSDYTILAASLPPKHGAMRVFQAGNMAAATLAAGIVTRPGVIKAAKAAVVTVATGDDAGTIDIKVNGTSILTSTTPLTIDSSVLAYTATAFSLDATKVNVKPGDVVTVVLTATHDTGALAINTVVNIDVDELPMTGDTIPLGHAAHAAAVNSVGVSVPSKPTGNDTYAIDILKNGTTILSAPISITSSATNKTIIAGSLSGSPTVVAGDYLEATITYTHSSGGPAVAGIVAEVKLLQTA